MNDQRIYIGAPDQLGEGIQYVAPEIHGRVFVKPNLTFPEYRPGVTTNPDIMLPLLKYLKSVASEVIVGESDGGNNSFKAQVAFAGHALDVICEHTGVKLVNLSEVPSMDLSGEVLGKPVTVRIPVLLREIDYFVSVPVMKVHAMTGVSLGLKNLWGCLPDTMRMMRHHELPDILALLSSYLKPITVVDGTWALDGHGPMYGTPVQRNLLVIGNNAVATDGTACVLMGINPEKIQHIRVASDYGLGRLGYHQSIYNTDWWHHVRRFKLNRTPLDYLSLLPFHSRMLSQLAWNSPVSKSLKVIAHMFRNGHEKEIAKEVRAK